MAPDWLIDALTAFQSFMDSQRMADQLISIAVAWAQTPLLVLLHEAGHALAVLLRRVPLRALQVRSDVELGVRVNDVWLRSGRFEDDDVVGGFVQYDATAATCRDHWAIAAAGPAASAVGVLATGWLTTVTFPSGQLTTVLGCLTLNGLLIVAYNLRASRVGAAQLTDGAIMRLAWPHVIGPCDCRAESATADPNAATSFPPPGPTP